MGLFFALRGSNDCRLVTRSQGHGELSSNNSMMADLAGFMHIHQEILIIDRNLYQIPDAEVW
jgi:hypothetical protein